MDTYDLYTYLPGPLIYPGQMTLVYESPLEKMYRIAFPEDPIREWSEKKIAEIEEKYRIYEIPQVPKPRTAKVWD